MDIPFWRFTLGFRSRLLIAGLCYSVAAFLQVFWATAVAFAAALVCILLGWAFLAVKGTTNRPTHKAKGEWQAVSDGEVHRIADSIKTSRVLKGRMLRSSSARIVFYILLVSTVLFCMIFVSTDMSSEDFVLMMAVNLALFSVPAFFFGGISVFIPHELNLKMPCFLALMKEDLPKGTVFTPYLRLDKDEADHDIPEDIRFILEPKRKPSDLVGVQFQASINSGPNGDVPYVYAVFLCNGKDGPTYRAAAAIQDKSYVVEAGGDSTHGTVVVRQVTSGRGYHTTIANCISLMRSVVQTLARLEK